MTLHFLDYNPVDKLADRLIQVGSLGKRIVLQKSFENKYLLRLTNKKNKEVGKYEFEQENLRESLIIALKLILTPTELNHSDKNAIKLSVTYSPIEETFPRSSYKNFYKDWRKYIKEVNR